MTEREDELFEKYLELLAKWQKVHRMIGSSSPRWIEEHVFLDSLVFLRVLPQGVGEMLDLGAGAGIPGLPLKFVLGDVRLTLVESRQRRASFLNAVVRELGLADVDVVNARAEELVGELGGRFDTVVMRCAGHPMNVFPVALELVCRGGLVVASGPPEPTPLLIGEWVTVPGARRGETRRFAVARRP